MSSIRYFTSGVLIGVAATVSAAASATDFTAGVVMEKMEPKERYTFVAGIIEGLAYARFKADGKEAPGMSCIYAWFYDDASAIDQVEEAFARYPDHLPGRVVGALVQMRCPL